MVYYKIPYSAGGTFSFPSGSVLCCSYYSGGYMFCKFESVAEVGDDWVSITESTFNSGCPDFPDPSAPVTQEVFATSAELSSGSIVLTVPSAVTTGTLVKFSAPCNCADITGGLVIDGTTYTIADGYRKTVTGVSDVWASGAMIAVVINTTLKVAYIVTPIVTVSDKNKIANMVTPADYVVEQGSNDYGKYVKWSSGRIECWHNETLTGVAVNENASGFYRSTSYLAKLPVDVATVDRWHLDVGPMDASYNIIMRLIGWGDTDSEVLIQAVSLNGDESNVTIPYCLYISGT